MTVITPISLSADWSVTVWVLAPPTQYMPGRHQVAVSSSRGVYTWGGGGKRNKGKYLCVYNNAGMMPSLQIALCSDIHVCLQK